MVANTKPGENRGRTGGVTQTFLKGLKKPGEDRAIRNIAKILQEAPVCFQSKLFTLVQ